MTETLTRTAFKTSRLLEFFTEKELTMQIGRTREQWALAMVKELIDNALDACEVAGVAPVITVTVNDDSISVQDNGSGLPVDVLERSLDYLVRVSDKNYYISPTRGQLGNALKCVWAAPFVISGERGIVEVITGGDIHKIDVSLDQILQKPRIEHTISPDGFVKTGTFVKIHWPEIASELNPDQYYGIYNPTISDLVRGYAAFNPHATFTLSEGDQSITHEATNPDWPKWLPSNPTSPHWYNPERLSALIAAYIGDEEGGGRVMTVREFVSEFRGLSSTRKQKTVTEAVDLSGSYLNELAAEGVIDLETVTNLLEVMQSEARDVKPRYLGIIGKDHFTHVLEQRCSPDSINYKKLQGISKGLPYVLEVAFGVYTEQYADQSRDITVGLNWSPSLTIPLSTLSRLLGEQRVDSTDPVMLAVHLACPRLDFTDRGKSRLDV